MLLAEFIENVGQHLCFRWVDRGEADDLNRDSRQCTASFGDLELASVLSTATQFGSAPANSDKPAGKPSECFGA